MGQGHRSGAHLDFRAWPGLGKGTGCPGPTCRSPLQSEALSLLKQGGRKGSAETIFTPFPWVTAGNSLKCWRHIPAEGKDSNQILHRAVTNRVGAHCLHPPSPSEGFTSFSVLHWLGFPSDLVH